LLELQRNSFRNYVGSAEEFLFEIDVPLFSNSVLVRSLNY